MHKIHAGIQLKLFIVILMIKHSNLILPCRYYIYYNFQCTIFIYFLMPDNLRFWKFKWLWDMHIINTIVKVNKPHCRLQEVPSDRHLSSFSFFEFPLFSLLLSFLFLGSCCGPNSFVQQWGVFTPLSYVLLLFYSYLPPHLLMVDFHWIIIAFKLLNGIYNSNSQEFTFILYSSNVTPQPPL